MTTEISKLIGLGRSKAERLVHGEEKNKKVTAFVLLCVTFLFFCSAGTPARAETTGPQWTVSSVSRPTNFAVGASEDAFVVLVTNTGGGASVGSVTVTDELPEGVVAGPGVTAEDELGAAEPSRYPGYAFSKDCAGTGAGGVSCTYGGVVAPDDTLVLKIPVVVLAGAAGSVVNVVRVSGGGAQASGVVETPTVVAESVGQARALTPFGMSVGGESTALSSLQAGGHPDITTTFAFNTEDGEGATAGSLKNIVTYEPPGVALDLAATPECADDLFLREECPIDTQVGVTTAIVDQGEGEQSYLEPVYNLAPEPGEIAKIAFYIGSQNRYEGDVALRAPGEEGAYGGKVVFANNTGGFVDVDGGSLTIWGVPASAIHDPLRWNDESPSLGDRHFDVASDAPQTSYFTNPTACTSRPLVAQFRVTSWQHPRESESPPATDMPFGPIVGCDGPTLAFDPSLVAEATADSTYAPTGLDVATTVPQTYPNPEQVASSTLEREVVTLPEGMTLNPSAGAGLGACTEAQFAQEGVSEPNATQQEAGFGCPAASRLATVKIKTPLLEEEVEGSVYLATSAPRGEAGNNPFNSLLALYLVARIPNRGVLIKVPGLVSLNETTGQITTTFGLPNKLEPAGHELEGGLPPLPFTVATFQFNQGPNAPLITPPTCGDYTVTAQLTPWSDPLGAPFTPGIRAFPIDTNCPSGNVPPFHPGVTAYPIHGNAGAYSPLYLKISRQDGEQEITGFSTTFPLGLVANLKGVAKCSEAQVEAARRQTGVEAETSPACPQGSEIGYSIAEAGVGSVLAQNPGKIYLGEPYDGAPFSVVSVTAAHVGPFDLGTVVIHFPLNINSETAQVTIPASPSDVIPHILKGIVVHLRNVRVYVNRQSFMVNPTNCSEQQLSATVLGNGPFDNSANVSDPFQLAGCEALHYEPKVQVTTAAHTSKADGASLNFKLTFPQGTIGQDANTKLVKVELPVQLPSRLTTLQKACTQAQFKANPEGCPAASRIGTARAQAAILPEPLEGPIYFVSNGGEAFPNLVLVVKGDGVTFHSIGDTFISKSGITSTTFHSVPDVPLESVEVNLPEGPYSALAANGSLCAPTKTVTVKKKVTVKVHGRKKQVTRKVKETQPTTLQIPTEFIPQSGTAAIHETTPISVTGCPRAHKAKAKHHKARKGGKK